MGDRDNSSAAGAAPFEPIAEVPAASTIPVRLRAAEAERAKRFAYALVDRDLLLEAATEIERLEGLYLSAVNGRREMRQGLRDARAEASRSHEDYASRTPAFVLAGNKIIKTDSAATYNQFHKVWHVCGFAWINSKRKWSSNRLLHMIGPAVREALNPDTQAGG